MRRREARYLIDRAPLALIRFDDYDAQGVHEHVEFEISMGDIHSRDRVVLGEQYALDLWLALGTQMEKIDPDDEAYQLTELGKSILKQAREAGLA